MRWTRRRKARRETINEIYQEGKETRKDGIMEEGMERGIKRKKGWEARKLHIDREERRETKGRERGQGYIGRRREGKRGKEEGLTLGVKKGLAWSAGVSRVGGDAVK